MPVSLCVRVCKQARHNNSIDCSSAPIVMEIALETVALPYIFRSASRKSTRRGGKAPKAVPALPLLQMLGGDLSYGWFFAHSGRGKEPLKENPHLCQPPKEPFGLRVSASAAHPQFGQGIACPMLVPEVYRSPSLCQQCFTTANGPILVKIRFFLLLDTTLSQKKKKISRKIHHWIGVLKCCPPVS